MSLSWGLQANIQIPLTWIESVGVTASHWQLGFETRARLMTLAEFEIRVPWLEWPVFEEINPMRNAASVFGLKIEPPMRRSSGRRSR